MQLGDRINTKLGWGTVTGFEVLGINKSRLSSTPNDDPLQRVVVALDDQSRWPWGRSHDQYHPLMCASDMLLPMAEPRVAKAVTTPAPTLPAPKPLPTIDPNLLDDIEMREHKHSVQMIWAFTLVMALVGLILVITTGHAK
jgi:hypothetical protein